MSLVKPVEISEKVRTSAANRRNWREQEGFLSVPDSATRYNLAQSNLDCGRAMRIIFTGGSARRTLRGGGGNLLPGRIWQRELFPLVSPEIGPGRVSERIVRGSLPAVLDPTHFKKELRNYVGLHLNEEIQAEGLVRGVGILVVFLEWPR